MIVKCGNCQTRFKIPDDKVTDKGVKVRCTKCQSTFRVTKADAQPALAPAAAPAEADPFANFGPAADPIHGQQTRPVALPPELAAMQPKVTSTASPLSPSFEAQSSLPREAFDQPTRIGPMPTAPPTRKSAMPGAGPPPRAAASASLPPSAFDPHAAAGRPPAPAFDPFEFSNPAPSALDPGSFGGEQAATNGMGAPAADPFDFGGAPIDSAPTRAGPRVATAPGAPAVPPPAFDFGSLGADPAPTAPQAPAFGGGSDDPFAFADAVPTAQHPGQANPFADVALTQPGAPSAAPAADPFAFAGEQTQTGAVSKGPGPLLADVPPATDPFGAAGSDDDSLGSANASSSEARAMFDMPERPTPAPPPDTGSVPLAAIKLQKMPASQVGSPSAPRPAPVLGDEDAAKQPGAARRMTGVVMNLAIAAVIFVALAATLLVYMNEGKVELASFTPARLSSMLLSSATWTAGDISNGLYDTRSGKPVFFVRGEVRNKGSKSGRVKVRAEILDGATVIRSAEVFVGGAPSPEDLYQLGSSADVDALNARLLKDAVDVAPGKTAAFLVAFYEYPPDLSPYRLKVTVVEGRASETAAR